LEVGEVSKEDLKTQTTRPKKEKGGKKGKCKQRNRIFDHPCRKIWGGACSWKNRHYCRAEKKLHLKVDNYTKRNRGKKFSKKRTKKKLQKKMKTVEKYVLTSPAFG